MSPEKPLDEELITEEETTPVADASDSNVFAKLAEEHDADDLITDYGVDEATEEAEVESLEEETPSGEEVLDDEEMSPLAAEAEEESTEAELDPTETPTPEVEAAAETPEVQETESEVVPEVVAKAPEPDKSYEALRTEALVELESKTFAISEEDAQTLVTEPEKILPKLAARVYMEAFENAQRSVMTALPQMILQTMSAQTAMTQATDGFYAKWPKIDRGDAKHAQTVGRIGQVYRQLNPTATAEQFTAEVGAQALLALGIPFDEIIDAPPVETPKPFQPASPSGTARRVVAAKPNGMWETMAEELLTDDE